MGGGKGPGAYYFWVYLQIVFLLSFLWKYITCLSKKQLLFVLIAVSVGCEIMFSIINLPEYVYRLLATRYLFLVFLSYYIWIREGVMLSNKTIVLSVLSIAATLFFSISNYDLEPIFFNTGWKTHRWICYYYVASLMVYVLWMIYNQIKKINWINKLCLTIGKCSYEIFLMQMAIFVFIPMGRFYFIDNVYARVIVFMFVTTFLSLSIGIIFKCFLLDKIYK